MTNGHWARQDREEEEARKLYALGRIQEADYLLGKQLHQMFVDGEMINYVPVNERDALGLVTDIDGTVSKRKVSDSLVQLSSNVEQIVYELQRGDMLYPDWFQNNINWVKSGHMSEQEFLQSYNYLIDQGLIHAPVSEPMIKLLSANVKISFTDSNIGGFSSSIPVEDIDKFQGIMNDRYENIARYTLLGTSTNSPISTLNGVINNIKDLIASVVSEVEPEVPEQMQFLCSDVYTLDNGSVVKTNYPTLSVTQIQSFISQGLMVRDCGTPSPTANEVRSHYGYTVEEPVGPEVTVPTEKFVVSKPGRLTISDMTNTNAWVGVIFAGALAVPVFSSILSKKK